MTDSSAALPEDVYRRIFESSPNAALVRDASGVVLAVNASFEALFGLDAAEVVGRDLRQVVRPADDGETAGGDWSLGGAAFSRRTRWTAGDGVTVDACPCQFPAGQVDGKPVSCVIFRDISGRRRAEEQLDAAERKYRAIFENAVEGIFQTTPGGRYLEVNRTLARIYGFDSVDEMTEHFRDIKNQLYVEPKRRDDFVRELSAHDQVRNFESAIHKKDGSVIWISENARVVRDADGAVAYYEGTVVDITDRKRAEEQLAAQRAYFDQLFANSPQAIALIDMRRNIVDVNHAFEDLFGFKAAEIKGYGMRAYIVPKHLLGECESTRGAILSGKPMVRETFRQHRDGRLIPVSMIGFPIEFGGQPQGIVYIYQDISERKAFEEQITHQAFHDALTGLPNRSLFADRLDRALTRARRRGDYQYAVLMIDLNKFKGINDTLGHQAGDQLLVEVSRRLMACVRSMDTVARLGGDEFAVILEELKSKKEVMAVVDRIGAALGKPCMLCGTTVTPGASVGIVLRTRDYQSPEDILRDADIAMYRAKESGRPSMIFDRRMHQEILDAINLEADLRAALDRGELLLHYQPIVDVQTGRIEGFEALVRWDHPDRGLVPPVQFIPLAEETGLIQPLGRFVIAEACRQLRAWQLELPEAEQLSVSVNVSCHQFVKEGLVDHVAGVLETTGLDPACLKLEITESVLMHDAQHTAGELSRLKALGVKIAIDDFGTGYSSLSYLRQLPIDHLKIDRSFISGDDVNGESQEIVKSIIALARSLGLTVIAEGVEHQDQLDKLRNADCDKAQGFMFSRPVDKDAALALLHAAFGCGCGPA
ncbi:sensor domain-containing protein [Solidesulfovibrio magneticus]|uniref:Signaling protein n=1 Tax=Solidesulfovibrio magneticus (strain ATCC 700980 / DSM 13731 / RS-1) TaxID=573370 RepID=C4XRM5_SOLM1|nr:EAL domain-containing protein [Solidesulfovibrio magneticus]BAH77941.1 putative signaling protein [Solidesulfovibrio magneticus RS-1]